MAYLPLRCDWAHFAPSHETLPLTYDPPGEGRLVSVQLEVRDFAGALVYRSDPLDCQNGPADVSWTGALNQGNDANTEPFATPLRSPYTLKINAVVEEEEDAGLQQPEDLSNEELGPVAPCQNAQVDAPVAQQQPLPPPSEVTVKVLYHSMEVVRGPWLATGEVFNRGDAASLCDKLNRLGYYAGPPARAAANTDLLDKAKERFRRNHGDLRAIAQPTADQFEDALDGALGHNGARPTLTDDQNQAVADGAPLPKGNGSPLRVYVEAVGFDEDLHNNTDEFMQQIPPNRRVQNAVIDWDALANKTTSEARKLNRPLVPLEAVIYLKGHDGARVDAPRAVGAVRVDWSALEPAEDVSHLPQDDRLHGGTRTYVHRLLRSERVDLENDGNTNCPALYGGIRTPANNYRNPFWREAQPYAPHAVPTDDGGAKALWVPAYTDHGAHAARVGRSGIYFQPSLIGGDRYKVRAKLSFAGRANAQALEAEHRACGYETRPIVVWRRVEVFGIVGWPLRNHGNLAQKCKARYADAYLEVDFTNTRFRRVSQVLNDADYAAWFTHVQTHIKPSVARAAGVLDTTHVHDACPVVLADANAQPTDTQKDDIWAFANCMFDETVPGPDVHSAAGFLLARISERLRTGHQPCGGVVMLEYKLSDGIQTILRESSIGQVPTTSNGNGDLMGIIDQAVDANPDYVFTHEVGHCFWLTHHEASSGNVAEHHDQFDHNCMMSYPYWGNGQPPYPHHAPDRYDPTFCGKCNLKLRGWNITHQHILAMDAPKPPDALSTLFYYDRADPGLRWDQELATVRDAFTRVSRGPFRERFFDRNANFDAWLGELAQCDIYHHVSHGNVRCSDHGVRLASMNMATPRYPTWCRNSAKDVRRLEQEEETLCNETGFDAQALTEWATKNLIKTKPWFHSPRSVIQWTVDDRDSSRDVEFTYEQIERAFKRGAHPPRLLAFFSSCLIGWDRRFARLFIDQGTPFVIAFRSRYETAQALPFSELFYRYWRLGDFEPERVRAAFLSAAISRPHAEPCLFTKDVILRARAKTMQEDSGDFSEHTWGDEAFDVPRFPAR